MISTLYGKGEGRSGFAKPGVHKDQVFSGKSHWFSTRTFSAWVSPERWLAALGLGPRASAERSGGGPRLGKTGPRRYSRGVRAGAIAWLERSRS